MKILMINNHYAPLGGAETLLRDSELALSAMGYELYFFAIKENHYYNNNYEYIKYFPEIKSGIKNYFKDPLKYYYNKEAYKLLKEYIEFIKPDIIHLHTIGDFTYSILNACKSTPTVMTIHSPYLIFCPAITMMKNNKICTECKNGNYFPCIKNKCKDGKFGKIEASIRGALKSYISYRNFKNIDMFITPSNALKYNVLECKIGIDKNKILTIPNFLTKELYNTIPNYNNDKYFLYVGRLEEVKGIQLLLEALNKLPRDIKLHIAGTGDYESELKKLTQQYNLNNVKFLGHKTREQLFEEYQNCIATIIPSNWFENFPTTNMESMINGKPIIGSNIGGIPEQVEHNVNGLLFEPANTEQLKECILTYWNNPKLVIQHGKNGYNKAKENYSEDIYYKKIIKIYEQIINEYKKENIN